MSKVKVTVSIDAALNGSLTDHAARTKTSRSRVIEDALRHWWRWKRHEELVEAYREMRNDSVELAEGNLAAGFESWDRS